MNNKDDTRTLGVFTQWAGAFLLSAGLFALAAIVAFGSIGRKSPWGWGFVVLGLVCLAAWYLGRRAQASAQHITGDQYSRQRTVMGLNAVISVLLLLTLLVGLNYIASRRHKTFDLTKNRINSLSDQTRKALDKLKAPVVMTYVWAPNEQMPQPDPTAQSVLQAYQSASDKVKVEYFNAVQDQLRLQQMGLSTFSGQPMLVIEPQNKSKDVSTPGTRQEVAVIDEQNITSAILKINNPKPRVLYFLSGHGELSPNESGMSAMGGALSGVRSALEGQNYTLKPLTLISPKAGIPSDAEAVLVVAPQVDLSPAEAAKLQKYVTDKGRLVLLLQIPRVPLAHWKSVLAAMNVELLDGQVLEFDQERAASPQIPLGTLETSRHSLLRGVSGAVVFPGVLPLKAKPAPPGAPPAAAPLVTPLFETSVQSEIVRVQSGRLQRGGNGPYAIAVAVERSTPTGEAAANGLRAVVAGNAAFCTDAAFNQFGNSSFFLSAVNWVAGNDALVAIPAKEPITNTINMSAATQRFAVIFSLFTLPVLLLMIGTVIWWKRR